MDARGNPRVAAPGAARVEKERGGEVAGVGDASLLPRKGDPGTRHSGAPEEGEQGRRGLGAGGTFRGSSPTSLQTCRAPGGGVGGAPEVPAKSPTPPTAGVRRGPTRGAHALRADQPVPLFDNIPRRPLFVFIVSERERISELRLKKPICFQ